MEHETGREPTDAELLAIGERLHTQDNRITQNPMFCLQILVRDVGYDPAYADGVTVWIDMQSGDYQEVEPDTEGAEEFGYKDRWETVMVAFTEQGIKDYMKQDGHNVKRRAHNGETRIYVESFYRCREMIKIREFLMSGQRPMPDAPAPDEQSPKLGETCMHGQLARQCLPCELEREVTRITHDNANLRAERDRLTARVAELEDELNFVVGWCQNSDNRGMHTLFQQCKLLDSLGVHVIAAIYKAQRGPERGGL